jgi:serine O-acetyltransferase
MIFKNDLERNMRGSNGFKGYVSLLVEHTYHLVLMYRLSTLVRKIPYVGKLLSKILEYSIRVLFSSDISSKSNIGSGLLIQHGQDIVIGADVVLGVNCTIFNGCTLGNKDLSLSSFKNQPTVGNNVTICTGAKILGPVIIGNNVTIGANSVVLHNIPDNCIAVGVPAVIKHENK